MHDGRDVAATRTDVGDEVRGHDAEAAAALRRHVEQPLTCASLDVLALRCLTCGTPPARARRAIEVRLGQLEVREGRASNSRIGAAPRARWRAGHVP